MEITTLHNVSIEFCLQCFILIRFSFHFSSLPLFRLKCLSIFNFSFFFFVEIIVFLFSLLLFVFLIQIHSELSLDTQINFVIWTGFSFFFFFEINVAFFLGVFLFCLLYFHNHIRSRMEQHWKYSKPMNCVLETHRNTIQTCVWNTVKEKAQRGKERNNC